MPQTPDVTRIIQLFGASPPTSVLKLLEDPLYSDPTYRPGHTPDRAIVSVGDSSAKGDPMAEPDATAPVHTATSEQDMNDDLSVPPSLNDSLYHPIAPIFTDAFEDCDSSEASHTYVLDYGAGTRCNERANQSGRSIVRST